MSARRKLSHLGLVCVSLTALLYSAAPSLAQVSSSLSRLSVNKEGVGGNGGSLRSSISPSGKLVAFDSLAGNLLKVDNNRVADIFVAGVDSSKIARASVGRKRLESNGASSNPSVSPATPNGSYLVAFESDATNLARNLKRPDTNGFQDIYATFFPKAFTFRISRAFDGGLSNARSEAPDVTLLAEPDRLFVVYTSNATNLVNDDANTFSDIYLTTVTSSAELKENNSLEDKFVNSRISSGANNTESDGDSSNPRISGDGNFIVFESEASNLLAGVSISRKQIYLYDLKNKTTTLISRSASGEAGNANSRGASINYNGRYISFISAATNLLNDGADLAQNPYQVLRYDRLLGITERVNSTNGVVGNGAALPLLTARIDASGRFVVFSDRSTNLVSDDTNSAVDVFIRDMTRTNVQRLSTASDGQPANEASLAPAINRTDFTALSGLATFASAANNLVPNDTEGEADIFLARLAFPPPPLLTTTTLDVPPTIVLSGKTAKLTLESFASIPSPLIAALSQDKVEATASTSKIQYSISYTRDASEGSRKETKRLTSKRNSLSLKNLRSGTYSTNYRVQVVRNGKVTSQSNKSPTQRFTIE